MGRLRARHPLRPQPRRRVSRGGGVRSASGGVTADLHDDVRRRRKVGKCLRCSSACAAGSFSSEPDGRRRRSRSRRSFRARRARTLELERVSYTATYLLSPSLKRRTQFVRVRRFCSGTALSFSPSRDEAERAFRSRRLPHDRRRAPGGPAPPAHLALSGSSSSPCVCLYYGRTHIFWFFVAAAGADAAEVRPAAAAHHRRGRRTSSRRSCRSA